ncbi:MAG: cation transporter [Kofleriaceae bacterium]
MSLRETWFAVPKMDCPSEERMIRLALEDVEGIKRITCDLAGRRVRVLHENDVGPIAARLETLGLGARTLSTSDALPEADELPDPRREARTLQLVLGINAVMFVGELVVAWVAHSAGLLADSLDMLADAAVYGIALYAVGRSTSAKLRTAHVAGWIQVALALLALAAVARRFVVGSDPEPPLMMLMSLVALGANVACLWLVSRHRDGGAHMTASTIFSANDVLANVGVLVAGALVAWTGSPYPDLVIGTVIAGVVLAGARRILRLR